MNAEARILADLLKGRTIHSTTATERYGVESIGPVVHRLRKLGLRINVTVGKADPNAPLSCEWRIREEHLAQARATTKAQGIELGTPTPDAPKARDHKPTQQAREYAISIAPVIEEIRRQGTRSLSALARELNARNIPTMKGSTWTGDTVSLALRHLEPAPLAA